MGRQRRPSSVLDSTSIGHSRPEIQVARSPQRCLDSIDPDSLETV
ncbi:hypothetical protein CKA32_005843 [Geitlerinema sp. FC II]|nr:hypothetical protein CKA32_005843 [Geitlerinema sp. FC II]